MMGPFYLDPVSKGGLGLTTVQVGLIQGQVGMLSLTLGGLLGGIIISRLGLKRLIWPMVLAMHVPNLFYVWASYSHPTLPWVYLITGVDQFGYGFGMAAYTIFVMNVANASRFPTSHFAIGTALMSLGAMCAGILSGYLQVALGYQHFFIAVCLCTIPGVIVIPFLPYNRTPPPDTIADEASQSTDAGFGEPSPA